MHGNYNACDSRYKCCFVNSLAIPRVLHGHEVRPALWDTLFKLLFVCGRVAMISLLASRLFFEWPNAVIAFKPKFFEKSVGYCVIAIQFVPLI